MGQWVSGSCPHICELVGIRLLLLESGRCTLALPAGADPTTEGRPESAQGDRSTTLLLGGERSGLL
jgi:hypothetical protein